MGRNIALAQAWTFKRYFLNKTKVGVHLYGNIYNSINVTAFSDRLKAYINILTFSSIKLHNLKMCPRSV